MRESHPTEPSRALEQSAMSMMCNVSPKEEVNRLVETCGYATAALTILPIPGAEILGVMPLHVGMVIGIANHYDRTLTRESATELLLQIGTTVGVSLIGSRLATTAAKFILPGLGGIIAAPFMYASTLGIGAVADAWFRHDGTLSREKMKEVYEQSTRKAKESYEPENVGKKEAVEKAKQAVANAEAGAAAPEAPREDALARLKRSKSLLEEGLITQEEYDQTKKRILDEL
jgi:uncharacterized protein (DUF697 family)